MKKTFLSACLIAATVLGVSTSFQAYADESNPSIVHRQGTYKVASGHMDSLKSILFLGGSGDAAYHAQSIKAAWEHMGNAYPEGSDKGETAAKPEIWENMDDFQAKGKTAYGATVALLEAAQSGDKGATIDAFKKLGGSCKACHKEYRKK
jgi:cytochrome c556